MNLCLNQLKILLLAGICGAVLENRSTMAKQLASDANWWKNTIFYQIYPRSFCDSNGDGIGDLKGITSKLSYLAETGITATWLSPIFKSPMVDFGYDISDFTAIHEEYGTMLDFEQMMAEARRLDIKIILDFVPNHTSDQHAWFKKSAARVKGYEDFYIWADGKVNDDGQQQPPNNWQSVFYGSAWTWHEKRQQYYLHQFTVEQPDLNFRNPHVIAAMDKVMLFWLDKGVMGFRVDAVNHLYEDVDLKDEPLSGKTDDRHSYEYTQHVYSKDLPEVYDMLHHWRRLLDEYTTVHGGPTRIMMTEAYADLKPLMDYYEDAKGLLGAHFPFNFFFITDLNAASDARDYVFNIQKWLTYMPRGHVPIWVMGNHDNPRVASRFGAEMVDAMNMLLLTLPGVAVTYNGEEIGMEDFRDISWEQTVDPQARNVGPLQYKKASRDPARTPFQWAATKNAGFSTSNKTWLPLHPNYKSLNLAEQQAAPKSHYKVYQALAKWKKSSPGASNSRFHIEALNRNVFAFKRELASGDSVMTIINIGPKQETVSLADLSITDAKDINILVVSTNSSHEEGAALSPHEVSLSPHECLFCVMAA